MNKGRPTLRDIAEQAGVSQTAASFAINNKPGVSEATRQRVRVVAAELGWMPSFAAKALSGARSNTIGMAISRAARTYGSESFFLRLVTGIQEVLSAEHQALLFQFFESAEEEVQTYRRWQAEGRVDGVILVDLRLQDTRPDVLLDLGLPAVIAGGPDPEHRIASVFVDDEQAMETVMHHLRQRGYRSVVYLCGQTRLNHVALRIAAFEREVADGFDFGYYVPTDLSSAAGASVTAAVLKGPLPPRALIFENEVLAVAGLSAISRIGLQVPMDVGVVSWEDTELCAAIAPSLTALHRDPRRFGAAVAQRLLAVIDGEVATDWREELPVLIDRESSAPTYRLLDR